MQEPLLKIAMLADVLRQETRKTLLLDDRTLLGRIIEASESMRELIRRLRDYLQLETNPRQIVPVELQQVVLEAKNRVSKRQEIDPIILNSKGLPSIEGDAKQLLELFIQLIDNSVRFRHSIDLRSVEISITGQLVEHKSFRAIQGKYHYGLVVDSKIVSSSKGAGRFMDHRNTGSSINNFD